MKINFSDRKRLNQYLDQIISKAENEGTTIALLESQMPEWDGMQQAWLGIGEKELFEWSDANSASLNDLKNWLANQNEKVFGYLSYDLKNVIEEGLESQNPDLISAPLCRFWVPRSTIKIDYEERSIEFTERIFSEQQEIEPTDFPSCQVSISPAESHERESYLQAIRDAQEQIYEGTYYEINLSRVIQGTIEGSSYALYRSMRDFSPVPMASFLSWDDFSVCAQTPERFLKVVDGKAISEPIKGTRKRGDTKQDDADLIEDLKTSEKERAENLMIVDLVRHDLSKVSVPGSVNVKELFQVRSYKTVHQMVSVIESKPNDDCDPVDLIAACFPMGSMTGAPKRSAMMDIERLENYRRGIYSGAIGYIDPNQILDFNVVIRSVIRKGEQFIYPVGGAITSDSDANDEWTETEVKSMALIQALV